jgi:Na+-transporting NADH:ubiquinone oxidoreductase subunit C
MNKNSNTYIFIYAAVMVIIVAFLMALVSSSLKSIQNENVANDKRKQILAALNISSSDPKADFETYQVKDVLVDAQGNQVADNGGFDASLDGDILPVYIANVNGETQYVLPMTGQGLWGSIWGYVGLKADKKTIVGVYFGHASETPGLGAEIAATKFTAQFAGRSVIDNSGNIISVVKHGNADKTNQQGGNAVDGVTASTLTSNGVHNMLEKYVGMYKNFLNQ